MGIINKSVKIKVWSRIEYYRNLGYDCEKGSDIIDVNISDLSDGSRIKIDVECDICGDRKETAYRDYLKYVSLHNFYSCYKCCNSKIKITNNERYGRDNVFQVNIFKEKSKETLFRRYGVYHPMELDNTKFKIRETCLERYGETSYTKTYEYLVKTVDTNIEKYGVYHPSKTMEFQNKSKKTRIERGDQLPDSKLDDYLLYRRLVDNLTDYKYKKILLDSWDGYDYYDGEFIRNNFLLEPSNRNYPTIDHKMSVRYGFDNNIPPYIIGNLDNLCVTKNHLNCSKGMSNEEEFLIKMKS